MRKNLLNQIINILYVNMQWIESMGLLQGKLGLTVFFYSYARYVKCEMYNTLADEWIDYILGHLNKNMPKNYADGLSGIGWGIDYLIKNRFIEGDDDILEEVDSAIENMTPSDFILELDEPIPLFSKGLYFIQRKSPSAIEDTILQIEIFLNNQNVVTLPVTYLNSLLYFLSKSIDENINPELCRLLINKLHSQNLTGRNESKAETQVIYNNCWMDFIFSSNKNRLRKEIPLSEIGDLIDIKVQNLDKDDLVVYKGLAGLGLMLMQKSFPHYTLQTLWEK